MVRNGWLVRRRHPVGRARTELDRVFDETFGDFFPRRWLGAEWANGWVPSLDVRESDEAIVVEAELPGVDAEKVEVSITDDVLVIAGEKKEEREEEREGYRHSERRFGSFRRTVTLPTSVDREKVAADYDNGVLTIRLEKSEEEVTKKIPVTLAKN
jgi:HSP20 family protein